MSQPTRSIAIAHGKLTSDGGAERVAIQLARTFDAPIYAIEVNDEFVPEDVEAHEVFNGRIASWIYNPGLRPAVIYWAMKHLYTAQRASWVEPLYDYDTVIVNKGEFGWFVPKPEQTLIRYLHSPPRRRFDQYHRRGGSAATRLFATLMRTLDRPTYNYPDRFVCNSEAVAHRLRRYCRVEEDRIAVVHPGVPVDRFASNRAETADYLFAVGRLAVNKRIDLLLDVADEINRRVVIAGDGPERTAVENGPSNVEYRGYISEREKERRLSEAAATLFLAEQEDFGIVPIESFASGTPVIGVDEGFTRHQILPGKNGYRCDPTAGSVLAAIDRLESDGLEWNAATIERFADQFSTERFRSEMYATLEDTAAEMVVEADLEVPEVVAVE